jgi:DNA-binding winged helix-turn-helix (wHTH) protein
MSDRHRFGPFELNASEHNLLAQGQPVALTRRSFDTLLYLVRHPGRLVTPDELIAAVWGETVVEEGNLHWTISAVRKALALESAETWIETVRGLGYRFLGAIETVEEETATASPPPMETQVLLARGQLDAAGSAIDQGLELARRSGFVTYELQGRLLQAELALARGRSGEARQLAVELATEARAKGFGIIAQRCALLIAQARGPAVRG